MPPEIRRDPFPSIELEDISSGHANGLVNLGDCLKQHPSLWERSTHFRLCENLLLQCEALYVNNLCGVISLLSQWPQKLGIWGSIHFSYEDNLVHKVSRQNTTKQNNTTQNKTKQNVPWNKNFTSRPVSEFSKWKSKAGAWLGKAVLALKPLFTTMASVSVITIRALEEGQGCGSPKVSRKAVQG